MDSAQRTSKHAIRQSADSRTAVWQGVGVPQRMPRGWQYRLPGQGASKSQLALLLALLACKPAPCTCTLHTGQATASCDGRTQGVQHCRSGEHVAAGALAAVIELVDCGG